MDFSLSLSDSEYNIILENAKKFNMDIKTYLKLSAINNGIAYNNYKLKDINMQSAGNILTWERVGNKLYYSAPDFVAWINQDINILLIYQMRNEEGITESKLIRSEKYSNVEEAKELVEKIITELRNKKCLLG